MRDDSRSSIPTPDPAAQALAASGAHRPAVQVSIERWLAEHVADLGRLEAAEPDCAPALAELRSLIEAACRGNAAEPAAAHGACAAQGEEALLCELSELAHRINNPLTSLLGRIQMLRLKHGADERLAREVEIIDSSAHRVSEYVQELGAIVRRQRAAGG